MKKCFAFFDTITQDLGRPRSDPHRCPVYPPKVMPVSRSRAEHSKCKFGWNHFQEKHLSMVVDKPEGEEKLDNRIDRISQSFVGRTL